MVAPDDEWSKPTALALPKEGYFELERGRYGPLYPRTPSLIRQFEFAQNVWINDRTFHELGDEHDPICGRQDGTMEFKIPKRPIRRVLKGLSAFTTLSGGAYFFLPGINGMRYLAALD